jgi:hypothetical protein
LFYHLLLAHLLGDYPLQPTWLLREKKRFRGLLLHAGIHFFTLVILVGFSRVDLWPILFLLATVHFTIDYAKVSYAKRYPDQVTGPYLLDQGVHLISLVFFTWLIQSIDPNATSGISDDALLVAIIIVGVTFVWGISERIFVHKNHAYLVELNQQYYGRMIARLGILAALALMFTKASSMQLAPLMSIPYLNSLFWRRALATDLTVSLVSAVFLLIVL